MCRLGLFSHALLRIRRKILAAPPRCSLDTRLGNKQRGCVPGEQQGGTDKNSASDPEQSIWENEPNLHILGLSIDKVGQFKRITVIICKCMHIYRCNLSNMRRIVVTHTDDWHLYIARFISTKTGKKQMKGGGGDVICAHQRTQGRSSSNTRPSQRRNNCTFKSKDE